MPDNWEITQIVHKMLPESHKVELKSKQTIIDNVGGKTICMYFIEYSMIIVYFRDKVLIGYS